MQRISVGVIGAGGLANNVHLPALRDIESAELVAVCDERHERAKKASHDFGIPGAYANYHAMLAETKLDCVFVLTEPDRLYRVVADCIAKGIAVFMEKPPGITLIQAESLYRESKKTGVTIGVGFNRRFIPVVVEALRILREHTEITHVDGRFYKHGSASFYRGCASAFECDTIHCLDFASYIANGQVVTGAMIESSRGEDVPNVWQTVMAFDSGVTANVCGHYMTGGRVHQLDIHGPGGSAYIDLGFGDSSCGAELILYNGTESHSIASKGVGDQNRISLDGRAVAGSDQFYRYYGFYDEDVSFVKAVASGEKPACDIGDGVKTMRLVEYLRGARLGGRGPEPGYRS